MQQYQFDWFAYSQPYVVLKYGDTSCPSGAEITTKAECDSALASLSFRAVGWQGSNTNIPSYCSVRAVANSPGNGHFNNYRQSVNGRADLAPVCKLIPLEGHL